MRILTIIALLILALVPSAAFAQEGALDSSGLLVRIGGPLQIEQDERVETAIVIGDNATVDGVVEESLFVIGGDLELNGRVDGDVTVIGGDVVLNANSIVTGDVNAFGGGVERTTGAVVQGTVDQSDELAWQWWGWMSFVVWAFLWLGFTVALILSGLLFAAIGGRQLTGSADLLTREAGPSILAAVVLWIGVPIAIAILMATVIGIPFGIGVLLMLLPALWWLGYIVAATRLGISMTSRSTIPAEHTHPYLPAVLGVVVLQVIGIIPALGFLIVVFAGLYGAGGLVLFAWKAWQRRSLTPQPATGAISGEQA